MAGWIGVLFLMVSVSRSQKVGILKLLPYGSGVGQAM